MNLTNCNRESRKHTKWHTQHTYVDSWIKIIKIVNIYSPSICWSSAARYVKIVLTVATAASIIATIPYISNEARIGDTQRGRNLTVPLEWQFQTNSVSVSWYSLRWFATSTIQLQWARSPQSLAMCLVAALVVQAEWIPSWPKLLALRARRLSTGAVRTSVLVVSSCSGTPTHEDRMYNACVLFLDFWNNINFSNFYTGKNIKIKQLKTCYWCVHCTWTPAWCA